MTYLPPPIRVPGPAAPRRRCSDCGAPVSPDASFCSGCGAAFGGLATRPTEVRVNTGIGAGFRFGIGFFLAAVVFSIVASILSILLAGAFITALTSGIQGAVSTGSSRFEGSGNARSAPFHLAGNVDLTWTAEPTPTGPCRHLAALTRSDRPIASETIVDQAVSASSSATHRAIGLPEADYVIDVVSTCGWTFRVTPIRS